MLLCFSGTGNSRYIADRPARSLRNDVPDLNARIKAGDYSPVHLRTAKRARCHFERLELLYDINKGLVG